ncbi:flagellin [Sphingosinicella sp. LHD-64]|uniref:flagellin N-terminal helical domain-containing protein n=1 Tax=Sphingosinicella sp. LHD-64 TaxID=3072139 RepID=UPI00280F1E7A|nr:flagellin [Sphingosinicella sp. LHD-64]MDQ8757193.1 flagellin [Sphingosinicella sp. LHD-64]
MISGTRYQLTLEINRQATLARDIARAQSEISTTKRILAPSDDPVAAARVSDIARTQADSTAWKRNLDLAASLSARADTTLKAIETAIGRAAELMVTAANGTMSDENRATVAQELRSIAQELESLKDVKDSRGNALFMSGTTLQIPVAPGFSVAAVATREDVFETVATSSGPQDIAAIVQAAADAIVEPDPAVRGPAIQQALDDVNAAVSHAATVRGEQGARGNRIDAMLERLADTDIQLEEERGLLEGTDIPATVARLSAKQLSLDAAQAVFARINQNTLFDILR